MKMSFSKAKLIRFNDIKVGTPAPTTPSSRNTPSKKAMSCEKSKIKPSEFQSPATSETGSCSGSVKSMPPKFKTPILPKKLKAVFSSNKIKPKDLFPSQNDLEALKDKTVECENKSKYIQELTDEIDLIKDDLQSLKKEKELLQREHQKEMEDIEFEMLKTMTILQNQEEEAKIKISEMERRMDKEITNLKNIHNIQIQENELNFTKQIAEIQNEAELNLKNKTQEIENKWKQKLESQTQESDAILKECQAISEYNIIQCELEKKEVQISLKNITEQYEELKQKYDEMLSRKSATFKENQNILDIKVQSLNEEINKKEEEIKNLQAEIKAYQITINTFQVTIEVLKKRLMNSDRDVEVLKNEIDQCEAKMLEYENKYWKIYEELKEARITNEELELQYESAIQVNETSINQTKAELLKKIMNYELEVRKYSKKMEEVYNYRDYILQQMDFQMATLKSINQKLDEVEEDNIEKEKEIEELKESNNLLRNDIKTKDDSIKNLKTEIKNSNKKCENLEEESKHHKTKAEELETDLKEIAQHTKKYIDLSGKYDSLLQKFENLQMEKIKMEKEVSSVNEIKAAFEKMKKEKEMLEMENQKMKNKLEDQKFKKLKFSAKDKENIGSPNRSLIESPNRASPFRERNN